MWCMNKMNNKKAQLTVFVILALVIVIGAGLFFAVRSSVIDDEPDTPQPVETGEVSHITALVETCLYDISKEAVLKIGETGGYTEISGMDISPLPYNSEVYYDNRYNIPYWYYVHDGLNFMSRKPAFCSFDADCTLPDYGDVSIQRNIESYIDEKLGDCINDFKGFEDIFDIKELAPYDVSVQIVEDRVITRLDYPLQIKSYNSPSESETQLSSFYSELDVPLQQMFKFAADITQAEADTQYIEQNMLNLISVYSETDDNYLPPFIDLKLFEVTEKFWLRSVVEKRLKEEVLPFIGLTKFWNALNGYPPVAHIEGDYYAFAQGFYNSLLVNLGENKTYNYSADIYYPNSEIGFYINDGSEIIRPNSVEDPNQQFMAMFKAVVKEYRFKYYLTFPVIVKIHDDYAFGGEGYDFYFAMEANIRNNVPASANMTILRLRNPSKIRIDDPNVLVNKTFRISVQDKHTDEFIEDAIISYNCGNDFTIGQTERVGNEINLVTKMPYCGAGGYIKAFKDGYSSAVYYFNNDESDLSDEVINLEVWPIHNLTFRVFKRTESDVYNLSLNGLASKNIYKTPLSINETVLFSIERINDYPQEDSIPLIGFQLLRVENNTFFESSIDNQIQEITNLYNAGEMSYNVYDELISHLENYSANFDFDAPDEYVMEVIPGEYNISMTVMSQSPFNIPAETKEICTMYAPTGLICLDHQDVEYPESNFSTWVTGQSSSILQLSENYLYNDKVINFYVLTLDIPNEWDDLLDENRNLETYSSDPTYEWMVEPFYE